LWFISYDLKLPDAMCEFRGVSKFVIACPALSAGLRRSENLRQLRINFARSIPKSETKQIIEGILRPILSLRPAKNAGVNNDY
jgi:hypothetical protein